MRDIIIYILGLILTIFGGSGMVIEGLRDGSPITAAIGAILVLGGLVEIKDRFLGTKEA